MKRVYRINALTAHLDPSLDIPAYVDRFGKVKKAASLGVRHVMPNEPIELDEKVGSMYLDRHGGSVEEKPAKAEKPKPVKEKEKSED